MLFWIVYGRSSRMQHWRPRFSILAIKLSNLTYFSFYTKVDLKLEHKLNLSYPPHQFVGGNQWYSSVFRTFNGRTKLKKAFSFWCTEFIQHVILSKFTESNVSVEISIIKISSMLLKVRNENRDLFQSEAHCIFDRISGLRNWFFPV